VAKNSDKQIDEQETAEPTETPDEAKGIEADDQAGEAGEEPVDQPAEELAAAKAEASKNWDLYLRSQAEMENFRKRMQREKQETAKFANENILREILPVVDNLERALQHAKEQGDETVQGLLEGIEMTLGQFDKALEKFGVQPVAAVGLPFNPAEHEAMGQVESTEHLPNTVAQQFQKGYRLHDRLLRPALVMIAKAPAASGEENESTE